MSQDRNWLRPEDSRPVIVFLTPETTLSDLLGYFKPNTRSAEWKDGPLAIAIRERRPLTLRQFEKANRRLAAELDLLSKMTGLIEVRKVYG